ncbi:EAL and HDOD domain-containing protein [Desulforegula conservatrix]|uniref:EAL and HDOD domain-containing protein n=1 Tax=Desulforegula conservatrix TaxID=153026 RepID=UPI00041473E8|nr:HDOD domain-containing protein [Desulforegula conservatrix]
MDAYVARQPIFDRKKRIFAYELLFRNSLDNFMPTVDEDMASSQILSSTYYTIGIDKITSGKRAFINFTQNLLEDMVPLFFPKTTTVVEILENVKPSSKVIEALKTIRQNGHIIAMDDFIFSKESIQFLQHVDIIKIDFKTTPYDLAEAVIKKVNDAGFKTLFLAEKIETNEEFQNALRMGFAYFQGYFFCKPEIIKGKQISTSQVSLLRITSEVNKPDFDLSVVEDFIARDVNLSFKLLKYINSAYFKRMKEISTIRDALFLMGTDELKRFVTLMAISQMNSSKPNELIYTSAFRAKFCELCGKSSSRNDCPSELFTLGIFSLIDAILDQPMDKIMQQLPLAPRITEALVEKNGIMADYLKLTEAYEKADWSYVTSICRTLELKESDLPALYIDACAWSSEIL